MCIYCNTSNYRKIYENHYGPIPRDEGGRSYEIHHIDGDHSNNQPNNLKALTIEEHFDAHYSQEDWYACWKISPRIGLSTEEISLIASNNNKKRLLDKSHHFLKTGKNSVNHNPTIYTFVHKDGRTENLTYYEMRTKYNLDASSLTKLIRKKKTNYGTSVTRVEGWACVLE